MAESLAFVLVVIFSAFDFWYVKNISGRFLVGLRWWNEVNEDGTEEWIYESEHEVRHSNIDTKIFWTSLYGTPIFWSVYLIFQIIGLNWLWAMVCLISVILSGSNMLGYFKCSGEQSGKLNDFIVDKGTEGISNLIMTGMGGDNNKTNNKV